MPRSTTLQAGSAVQERARKVGATLSRCLRAITLALPGQPHGPQKLAEALGVDKVLTSRMLKALRQRDHLAVLHHAPGPEPLRRAVEGARRAGIDPGLLSAAESGIEQFDQLIREEAGDRSSLGTILSAWLPEARAEFELRRKQAAFRAMSELNGASAETDYSAVFIHPSSEDPELLDVVWLIGKQGVRRLRPGVLVRFTTRRVAGGSAPRRPVNLDGEEIEGFDGGLLNRFCASAPAPIEARPSGEIVHYLLGETGFGPRSSVDFVFAEVNRAELPRKVPAGSGRKAFFFAQVSTPARNMQFDVFVENGLYGGHDPELHIYDTTGQGVANVNDRERDIDRMDVIERVEHLGRLGPPESFHSPEIANYTEICEHVFERTGWSSEAFRGYRCHIDFPIYGSQNCLAFPGEE